MRSLKALALSLTLLVVALPLLLPRTVESQTATEAPSGFDNGTNGCVDQATHDQDRHQFENVENKNHGLGPTYNDTSCANCHSEGATGGAGTTTELRAGHLDNSGNFVPATAFVNFGTEPIPNRSLINLKAICDAAKETLTATDDIHALRLTVNVLGDGYVEAIADSTLQTIAANQPAGQQGEVITVPAFEGGSGVGRFGWKDQHVSLLSFSSDAYLNEMGISNRLAPDQDDFTHQCDTVNDPEDTGDDIDTFTRFMRATKVPPRDTTLAATSDAVAGAALFDQIGCSTCHVSTIVTAPPSGTSIGVPLCLGSKIIHPYSDFLLHKLDTGDSIVQNGPQNTLLKIRTAPLWGLRTHLVFMHDAGSPTISDAIQRHGGQAKDIRDSFNALTSTQQNQLFAFLNSL
jgi:CxxC motif-containing protein (DUF1111 family)